MSGIKRSGALFGALAVAALAILLGTSSVATAKQVVKTVPATVVAQWKFNPTNDLQCGALAFVKWTDPSYRVSERFPTAWTAFYTQNGQERSISGTPPFHDLITHVGATYAVGGSSHWLNISFGSRVGAGAADGCGDIRDNMETIFIGPARVEITFELKDPPVNQKKCKAARKTLRERNKAVGKLLGKLRRASSPGAKNRIRKNLAEARDKRADAVRRVAKNCT